MNKSQKIIVTGANGLVGTHVLTQLVQQGFTNVLGMVRDLDSTLSLPFQLQTVQWVKGDILDIMSLDQYFEHDTIVIHTAGLVSYHPKDRDLLFQVNEEGTANVVNIALDNGIKKLVHISSIAALGRKENQYTLNENAEWVSSKYNTTYSESKYLGEQQVWRGIHEGLHATILNPSIILGCGDFEKSSLKLIRGIAQGSPFCPIGATGFVDAVDVATATLEAIDHKYDGERYIVSGHNLSYNEFFDMVDKAIGQSKNRMPLNSWWGGLAWRTEWLRSRLTGSSPLITKKTALSSRLSINYENDKSKVFFENDYTPINVTVANVVNCYLTKHQKRN